MRENEFLLYPLDTGEDPACLHCGKIMAVEILEARDRKPYLIAFRCESCGRIEKFICEEPPTTGAWVGRSGGR